MDMDQTSTVHDALVARYSLARSRLRLGVTTPVVRRTPPSPPPPPPPPPPRATAVKRYASPIGPSRLVFSSISVALLKPNRSKRIREIFADVAAEHGADSDAILSADRSPALVALRAIAIHRALSLGYGYSTIGRAIGRDHTTVMWAAQTRDATGARIPIAQRAAGG